MEGNGTIKIHLRRVPGENLALGDPLGCLGSSSVVTYRCLGERQKACVYGSPQQGCVPFIT